MQAHATWSPAACAHSLTAAATHIAENASLILGLLVLLLVLFRFSRPFKSSSLGLQITALLLQIRRGWKLITGNIKDMNATAPGPMEIVPLPVPQPRSRRSKRRRRAPKSKGVISQPVPPAQTITPKTSQPYDAFLVLDVEATCQQGSGFDYPNEIIELPVYFLRWKDKTVDGKASQLEIVDKFHSFVKPTWRPLLSTFCTQLTGITQESIDSAPIFTDVIDSLRQFLAKHELIDPRTSQPLVRFCWCTDGPHDIRDFFVKQCFISQVSLPDWIKGDAMDVRSAVVQWVALESQKVVPAPPKSQHGGRRPFTIPLQLQALGLPPFEGRQHCGMDDARNVASIVTELARKDVRLQPNTPIHPNRRWPWMGKSGQVLEASS